MLLLLTEKQIFQEGSWARHITHYMRLVSYGKTPRHQYNFSKLESKTYKFLLKFFSKTLARIERNGTQIVLSFLLAQHHVLWHSGAEVIGSLGYDMIMVKLGWISRIRDNMRYSIYVKLFMPLGRWSKNKLFRHSILYIGSSSTNFSVRY